MKILMIIPIFLSISACSLFDSDSQKDRYGYRQRPKIQIDQRTQGIEVPNSMCDLIDGDVRLGGLRVAMYNGRCIVQTSSYY